MGSARMAREHANYQKISTKVPNMQHGRKLPPLLTAEDKVRDDNNNAARRCRNNNHQQRNNWQRHVPVLQALEEGGNDGCRVQILESVTYFGVVI